MPPAESVLLDTSPTSTRRSLTAKEIMAITRHRNRAAFWNFVHRSGVPHIRLNSRHIIFDEQTVCDWLASHSTVGPRP